jgi:hypothetical protein
MNRTRKALFGLIATSTLAVPFATATAGTADAALRAGRGDWVVDVRDMSDLWRGRAVAAFSPNGDHVKDKARLRYKLKKKSEVTIKVRRTNKAETLVHKARVGKVTRGSHTWTWKGKNSNGKVVRDGSYLVTFVANPVADGVKTGRDSGLLHVDTKFDARWKPAYNGNGSDTVYPRTLVIYDWIGLTLGNSDGDPSTTLGGFETTLKNSDGRVISKGRSSAYHDEEYPPTLPLGFNGRHDKEPLPAGAYTLRYKVWDLAGNPGGAKSLTVHVSDKRLVEARGSLVAPPAGPAAAAASAPAETLDGRSSVTVGQNEPPRIPCGKVVPSELYSEPGAMSYQSSDACGDDWFRPALATAGGNVSSGLSQQVAPRGVQTAVFSMRGKPTVSGETDTARFAPRINYPGAAVTSPAVAEEMVTSTPRVRYEWEPMYAGTYTWDLAWTIETYGNDSFDVADVTVDYTYLTPQS